MKRAVARCRRAQQQSTRAVPFHPTTRRFAKLSVSSDPADIGLERFSELIGTGCKLRGIVEENEIEPPQRLRHRIIFHTMRDKLGLPSYFTLDACRHGGMTELEEAELTDGQGRALSAHKSQQAYEGYAKRTMERALSATRKRHAHRLANMVGTNIQNEPQNHIQNAEPKNNKNIAK